MAYNQPHGEAAAYYNSQQAPNPYGQPQYGQPQYGQPPYAQPGPPGPPPNFGGGYGSEKPMFDQAFKIERPKYNDIWAGVLVRYVSRYMHRLGTDEFSSSSYSRVMLLSLESRLTVMVSDVVASKTTAYFSPRLTDRSFHEEFSRRWHL